MSTDLRFILRRFLKSKLGSTINTFGLTIGIFVSLLLANYIVQESTYDHHHSGADRIYKVISRLAWSENENTSMGISLGTVADEYQAKFPQVENTTRLYGPSKVEVDLEESRLNNIRVLHADYSFFQMFDFPQITPDIFSSIENAVISRRFADKLPFQNPVGEQIKIEGKAFIVNAVVDLPYYTMFQFDVLLPLQSDPSYKEIHDAGLEFETYVLLREDANNEATLQLLSDHYNTMTRKKWDLYESDNYLLPLKDVYLDSTVGNRMGNGNRQLLIIIFTISVLILGLALINYINLQIANNHSRTTEIRLRKIMGAGRTTLLKQGVLESLLIISLSGIAAILLLNTFYLSTFSQLLGAQILTIRDWGAASWALFVSGLLVVGIATGTVPALKLLQFKSITPQGLKKSKLGKLTVMLVIFQFFVTTSLLTTILFVNYQMDFLKNLSPGYDSDQVVMINNLNENHKENYHLIRTELEKHPDLLSVAGAQGAPGNGASGQFVHRISKSRDQGITIAHIRTLSGYAETLNLEFTEGGDFTIEEPSGETQFILNESAAKLLFNKSESPINEVIDMSGRIGKVVGVVKDFHYRSFHHKVSPLAINIEDPYNLTMMIKVGSGNIPSSLEKIEEALSSVDPLYAFDYQFLDERFAQTYNTELRAKTVITYATIIAFSISILGLLALSIFVINSRIKEIALRKTLGGSNLHIFWRLSFQLIGWIVIGNLLSMPLSYLVAQQWVQDFVYQVDLNNLFWMSPMATLVTVIVAMSAILRKLYKTMILNPVEFLRHE